MENFESAYIAGRNPVIEVLKSGRTVDKILIANGQREGSIVRIIAMAKERGIPVVEVPQVKLAHVSGIAEHQGVAALCAQKEYCTVADILDIAKQRGEKPFVLVTDGIEDPHNLGALIRTASTAGVHGVIVPRHRAVGLTPSVSKAAAGALEYMAVAKVTNITAAIEELKEAGVWVYAADVGGVPYYKADLRGAVAIVVGGEGSGVSRLVRSACDGVVSIPIRGEITSLNASVAGAIIMYEAVRQSAQ